MTDLPTLESWIAKLGFSATRVDDATLRLRPPVTMGPQAAPNPGPAKPDPLPPFFLEWTPNWAVLSILPILERGDYRAEDLGRRLLAANRDMRLAKFALDKNRAVVLCAELPTESLDFSEVESALTRMVQYARRFRRELIGKE